MYYSKITFDISSIGKCPPCLQSFRSGSQSLGLPYPSTPCCKCFGPVVWRCDWQLAASYKGICLCPSLCSVCCLWDVSLSQFSWLNRQNPIWQQLLAAVLNRLCKGPVSECWCKEEGRALHTPARKEKEMELPCGGGRQHLPFQVCCWKSVQEIPLYKETQNTSNLWFGSVSELTVQDQCSNYHHRRCV